MLVYKYKSIDFMPSRLEYSCFCISYYEISVYVRTFDFCNSIFKFISRSEIVFTIVCCLTYSGMYSIVPVKYNSISVYSCTDMIVPNGTILEK